MIKIWEAAVVICTLTERATGRQFHPTWIEPDFSDGMLEVWGPKTTRLPDTYFAYCAGEGASAADYYVEVEGRFRLLASCNLNEGATEVTIIQDGIEIGTGAGPSAARVIEYCPDNPGPAWREYDISLKPGKYEVHGGDFGDPAGVLFQLVPDQAVTIAAYDGEVRIGQLGLRA